MRLDLDWYLDKYRIHTVESIYHFDKLMSMGFSPIFQSFHRCKIYDKHDEIEESNVMSVGIVPKRQDPLIYHYPFHCHRWYLGHDCRPNQMLIVSFRYHHPNQWEKEWNYCAFDFCLRNGILAGRVVEVEPAQSDATAKECQIVKKIIFVKAVGAIHKLRVAIVSFYHLVHKVECWDAD